MPWCPEILPDIPLTTGSFDRAAHERRDPTLLDALLADPATLVLPLTAGQAPVTLDARGDTALGWRPPAPTDTLPGTTVVFLGRDGDGLAYLGVFRAEEAPAPERAFSDGDKPVGPTLAGLRAVGMWLSADDASAFATTLALAHWHRGAGWCPGCGAPTDVAAAGWMRVCQREGHELYPSVAPSIIVAVQDDDERLLLGRAPSWPPGRFSTVAGFVEPGESFEQTVAREVAEETGVTVAAMRYVGSQPWPFPGSLMVGFAARAHDPTLRLDPVEMAEARWLHRHEYLAELAAGTMRRPTGFSIALRLIGQWLGRPVDEAVDAWREGWRPNR